MLACGLNHPLRNAGLVLIVEDERMSRKAMGKLLRSCGYRTITAGSGEEAVRMMESDASPDVALLDVDLPGMSGLELAERLEASKPGIFTVLITAAGGERIASFMRDHSVAYLRKPLDFEDLLCLLGETQVR